MYGGAPKGPQIRDLQDGRLINIVCVCVCVCMLYVCLCVCV